MTYLLSGNMVFLVAMLLVAFMIGTAFLPEQKKKPIKKYVGTGLLFIVSLIFLIYVVDVFRTYMKDDMYGQRNLFAFLTIIGVALGLFCFTKYREGKLTEKDLIWLVFLAGIGIRIIYILYTPVTERQNDVGFFKEGSTHHLGYVYYIFTNGKLPEIDPREAWQFYNPPFHYILCAFWIKLQTICGVVIEQAVENIQLLTLLYSGCIMITADKIAAKLGLKGGYRILNMSLVAFTPYFIIGAGAVNQDTLVTLLMLLAVYTTLCWIEKPCIKRIIPIAITIGLGMMTKITAGILAVPVGTMFMWYWIKERKRWKYYLSMYGIFAVIVFPIGMWFPIKNYILYQMPVVWSPPSSGMEQYTGNFPIWSRFFDFDPIQFKTLCISWTESYLEAAGYIEHNIPLAFVKHLAFSDWPYCMYTSLYYLIGALLLIMISVLIAVCVGLFIYWIVKGEAGLQNKVFLLLTGIVSFLSYLYFCFSKPYVAAMNVRYVLLLVLILFVGGVLGLKTLFERCKIGKWKWIRKAVAVAGILYGVVASNLYILFMIKA